MTSAAQLAANRENAQHSTGPKTEEGKRRASLNASRHNLTGQVTAMTDEDRAAHDQFSTALLQSLAPEGAVELQLAQRVATDSWRLNRIAAIEDNLFALGLTDHGDEVAAEHPEVHAAFAAARTFEAQAKNLQLLSLYEQRLNRAVQKNLATLRDLQAEREAARAEAMEEATKLHRLSEAKGRPYDPAEDAKAAKNGFVFSIDEIRAALDRRRRLERAEHLDFRRHKREKRQTQTA